MQKILYDRIFWIYFTITIFFVIIGISCLLQISLQMGANWDLAFVILFWLGGNIALLLAIYEISISWGEKQNIHDLPIPLCIREDDNSPCFQASNKIWVAVNILFLIILVLSVLWAAELQNTVNLTEQESLVLSNSAIFLIICGILLIALSRTKLAFQISLIFISIWVGLGFYTIYK